MSSTINPPDHVDVCEECESTQLLYGPTKDPAYWCTDCQQRVEKKTVDRNSKRSNSQNRMGGLSRGGQLLNHAPPDTPIDELADLDLEELKP